MSAAAIESSPTINSAPSKVRRAGLCHATLTGSNSEGGGGPGQEPIDNFDYGIDIVGPSGEKYSSAIDTNGFDPSITVPKAEYGGTFDSTCSGNYYSGDNSWTQCYCNLVPGFVEKTTISIGIVTYVYLRQHMSAFNLLTVFHPGRAPINALSYTTARQRSV